MKITDFEVSDRVIEELNKVNLTPAEIAQKIGCCNYAVLAWLEGINNPSPTYLMRLQKLGCDVYYIISGEHANV